MLSSPGHSHCNVSDSTCDIVSNSNVSINNEETILSLTNENLLESLHKSDSADGCNCSEISDCPDTSHFLLLSSEESEFKSNSDSEVDRESLNSDSDGDEMLGDENSTQKQPEDKMVKFLQYWAVNFGIPQNALDALLLGLQEHPGLSHLPKSSRTLLKTPRSLNKISVPPGEYVHIGIEFQLKKQLKDVPLHTLSQLSLLVNIDGLPPYKSCQGELYPILISVLNIPELRNKVFPVGIRVYYGLEKTQ